jgi:hypothetical protein
VPRDARAKAREAEIKTLNPAVTPKHTLLSDRAPADALGLRGDVWRPTDRRPARMPGHLAW